MCINIKNERGAFMRFEPIDVNKHREYIITFRRDSFIVSFGTDEAFGKEEEYIDWVKLKSNEFPDGLMMFLEDGLPIGQLELTIREYNGSRIGYVNLYYLIREKRGVGLGNKLHQYALKFFRNHGLNEYHLRVSPNNQHALEFYRKNNMVELGTEHDGKVIRMKGIL